jgi:2-polyprenyl-3-methyl-5-hydroxy-6-metoxy-1,4-benzoquinol methylase
MIHQTAHSALSESTSESWQKMWARVAHHPQRSFSLTLVNHAPLAYNRYLARFQKLTVLHALKHIGSLAGKWVLDIGCGQGRWTSLWSRQGAHAVGIDISVPLLAANLRRPPHGVAAGSHYAAMAVQDLGIAGQSIDMISSVTVLQHIPYETQRRAIRELVRCVKPGGLILLHEHVRRQPGIDETGDCTTFPNLPEEWVRMFAEEGCQVIFTERCPLMPLFTAYWLVRNRVLRLATPAGSRPVSSGLPSVSRGRTAAWKHDALARLYRTVNCRVYWLLTWPSWAAEYLLWILPRKDRWTGQTTLGAHQTFLFRRGVRPEDPRRPGHDGTSTAPDERACE